MAMMARPQVRAATGGRCWEHTFEAFRLKAFVPDNALDGQVNNYGFRAPLLMVFEEVPQDMESAVRFAWDTGLARIAARYDGSVLFVHPTCEGGWRGVGDGFYAALIAEIKMIQVYRDGIVEDHDFFTHAFRGWFARGAIFRADIYSFGASADYVATHLLKTQRGEYLWGPGEITPAMCSMERLSAPPQLERRDIPVMSVGNPAPINRAFEGCEHLRVVSKADYEADFDAFVRRYKMWCGRVELEPDFPALHMKEDALGFTLPVSPDNRALGGMATHRVGCFAYYNDDLFNAGPAPLVLGFHGGGDSSLYLTYTASWWEIAHKYRFLFVSVENHQFVTATEAVGLIEALKRRYPIDARRIYATGFSMGSGKTWDLFQQYPQVFAGLMPVSALFPVYTTLFGEPAAGPLNRDVPVPVFYSGGEDSHLPELPFQKDTSLERVQYLAQVNRLKKRFDGVRFEDRAAWEDPIWGVPGDRVERVDDPSRGSALTIHYYDSADGVCRTALASVSHQVHECRQHSCECAWRFISQFTR